MDNHSERSGESPYSTLGCILLLLGTGIVVKTGAAIHLCQLAQGSCHLPLSW
jgi:hypothetical protein